MQLRLERKFNLWHLMRKVLLFLFFWLADENIKNLLNECRWLHAQLAQFLSRFIKAISGLWIGINFRIRLTYQSTIFVSIFELLTIKFYVERCLSLLSLFLSFHFANSRKKSPDWGIRLPPYWHWRRELNPRYTVRHSKCFNQKKNQSTRKIVCR